MSGPPPPLERNCKPGASNQQELPLTYVTAKTQLTGWSTPCTDGPIIFPPSPHVLEFTEKPMQCNMYKKVTIHVYYHLKCLSAPGKMVSFSQS